MRVLHGETFPHVYWRAIEEVMDRPDNVKKPRGMLCREVAPLIMQFPVGRQEYGLFTTPTRSTDMRYLAGELMWYYSGSNRLEDILPYSKFWRNIANEDGTLNSAYGWQLFRKKNDYGMTEWRWAIRSLSMDQDTRQAVMLLHAPRHHRQGIKDLPCTLNVNFQRRQEYLDMNVVMRSNDLWFGVPYDIPFFISLLRNACHLLDLTPGMYTHIALNMHAYEKDWPSLQAMLDSGLKQPSELLPRHELPWVNADGDTTRAFEEGLDPLAAHLQEVSGWLLS